MCILPDARAYTRPENNSLVFGWREPDCVWVDPHELPDDTFAYRFAEDPEGWSNLERSIPYIEPFFPDIVEQGIAHYVTGFSAYTPDGLFNAGEIPGFPGLYAAAGCAGMGIAVCGGIGRALADCIVTGTSELPSAPFAPGRFGPAKVFSKKFMQSCAEARAGKKTG